MRKFPVAVPNALQDSLLRWMSEFETCDRARDIAKALDVVVEIYEQFLSQFTRTADLRGRIIDAPTKYMVTSENFCDRSINSLAHSIYHVTGDINKLFDHLNVVRGKCVRICRETERMTRELEIEGASNSTMLRQRREK